MSRRLLLVISALALAMHAADVSGQAPYPRILALRDDDVVFAQLSDSIEHFLSSARKQGYEPQTELSFYSYILPREANLFEIAAAVSLPYDTLATLNRLDSPAALPAGTLLIIPSEPGIFVCDTPRGELEFLMRSLWQEEAAHGVKVRVRLGQESASYTFYPGAEFHASERTFFLVAGFRFPLPKGVITSGFGARVDPFTGRSIKFHAGIDIGAPLGTQVFAARAGKVESVSYSDVYGNFILLSHGTEWETLYGHLSKTLVVAGQQVGSGDVIGLVGSTGMSTGPHLHFETRRRGVATDPAPLIVPR